MTAGVLLLQLLVGYLFGSLSGARIVGRSALRGQSLEGMKVVLDGTGSSVTVKGVSPSTLLARSGPRAGLRASAIDILKVFIPAGAAAWLVPGDEAALLLAAGALIGHVLPVWHRFRGGFGISPLLGALLIIDPLAALACIGAFALIGFLAGSAYLGLETWPLGLLVWFAVFGSPTEVLFAVLANVLYWVRSRHEAVAAVQSFRQDPRPWSERIKDFSTYPDYEAPGP